MDLAILVQNIKLRCKAKGIPPTVACKEADVGTNFITDINKGSVPSIAKVQKMSTYLGCTVSELLGEKERPGTISDAEPSESELIFRSLPPQKQEEALRYMRYLAEQGDK